MLARFVSLLLLVAIAYIPAYSGQFIWDDDQYVEKQQTIRTAEGLEKIWLEPGATPQYYPLVFTTFWVEYHLWRLNPIGYHIDNALLHGLNAGLIWLLLCRLQVPGAWLAAAIFGLHPVHVESVAWITERKNVLSGFFYLASFLAFLKFSNPAEETCAVRSTSLRGVGWYALALILFVAALLSKSVTCSLPAVLVLIFWWNRGSLTRREILALAPMFVVGAALAFHTAYLEKAHVGAEGKDWDFSLIERCLIAGRALWFYAGKLIWPYPLIFNYHRWHIDSADPWQYGYPAAAILVLLILADRARRSLAAKQWGRAPLVAVLIFAGTLVPALGFFNIYPMIYSFVADHFQYLASIAVIASVAAGICQGGRRWFDAHRTEAVFLAAAYLLILGCLTWKQCHVYENRDKLWDDTVAKNPTAHLALYNYGTEAMHKQFYDVAISWFQKTVDALPSHSGAYNNWGSCLTQLADQARKRGDESAAKKLLAEAEEKIRKALEYDTGDEDKYFNLGTLLAIQGKDREALPYFEKALELAANSRDYREHRAGYPDGEFRYGCSLLKVGRKDEAIRHLQRAVDLVPSSREFKEVLEKARRASK